MLLKILKAIALNYFFFSPFTAKREITQHLISVDKRGTYTNSISNFIFENRNFKVKCPRPITPYNQTMFWPKSKYSPKSNCTRGGGGGVNSIF